MSKILYCLCSPAGGGKTTKAKTLAAPENIFEADNYWLNCVGEYLFVPEKIGKAHAWCQSEVRKAMEIGNTPLVVSNTNITRKDRQVYHNLAKEYGYEVEIVFPDSPWFKDVHPRLKDKTFTDEDVKVFVEKNTHGVPFEGIKRMMSRWEED